MKKVQGAGVMKDKELQVEETETSHVLGRRGKLGSYPSLLLVGLSIRLKLKKKGKEIPVLMRLEEAARF